MKRGSCGEVHGGFSETHRGFYRTTSDQHNASECACWSRMVIMWSPCDVHVINMLITDGHCMRCACVTNVGATLRHIAGSLEPHQINISQRNVYTDPGDDHVIPRQYAWDKHVGITWTPHYVCMRHLGGSSTAASLQHIAGSKELHQINITQRNLHTDRWSCDSHAAYMWETCCYYINGVARVFSLTRTCKMRKKWKKKGRKMRKKYTEVKKGNVPIWPTCEWETGYGFVLHEHLGMNVTSMWELHWGSQVN